MARPRKYVQDANGWTVDGLSFRKPSGRYYSIGDNGQRRYHGTDRDRATAEHHRVTLCWLRPDLRDAEPDRPGEMLFIDWNGVPQTKPKRRRSKGTAG